MWSLAHTLERIRPLLPPALVSGRALARVADVARRLPARLSSRFYLERWLAEGPPRVDLIVRIDARGRSALEDRSAHTWDEELLAHTAWQRLASFAREWAAPGGALERGVEGLWLEFDLPAAAAAAATPVPRVFVDFTREGREGPIGARLDLMQDALRPLLPGGLDGAAMGRLRGCLERLPPGASIPYVGLALGNGEPWLRVCAQGLGRDLVGYLRALGWPGDGHDLESSVLTPLGIAKGDPLESVSVVHLDVASGIAPRIGLEYAFARAIQASGRVREVALLEHLRERGWCSARLCDGLLRWPGTSVELLPHEIWLSRLSRRLNHVKLTYATGQPIGLKAYLCFQHELAAGGTLVGHRPWLPPDAHPSAIG